MLDEDVHKTGERDVHAIYFAAFKLRDGDFGDGSDVQDGWFFAQTGKFGNDGLAGTDDEIAPALADRDKLDGFLLSLYKIERRA